MITINPTNLEAVSLCMSSEQTRYYMCGVCVETYADGSIGLISTDGRRLATMNAKIAEQPVSSFIMHDNDVDASIKMAKAVMKEVGRSLADNVKICVKHEAPNVSISVMFNEEVKATRNSKEIDGNFPDWRRVIPSSESASDCMGFNGFYLHDFGKIAKIFGSKAGIFKMTFTGNDGPVKITMACEPSFLGILMPVRANLA